MPKNKNHKLTAAMRHKLIIILILLFSFSFAQDKRRIGLIPFENATGNSKYDWVSYGLEYYLYSKLSTLSGFFVPDKNSFRQSLNKAGYGTKPLSEKMIFHIGKYSGVEVAVSGSFKMYGNNLELKVLYSNAFNGTELLSATINAPITDFFTTGRKVVDQVVTLAGINVNQTERRLLDFTLTNSISAYGSFIKAYMENEKGSGRIEVVTGLFRRAIREDAKFWEAYYNLGIVYFNSASYNNALQQFNTVIKALPNFDKPYFGRGLIYNRQKKYDLAKKDFKKVIEFNPNDFKPFFYLGRISLSEKKFDEALDYLKKALHINPNYAPAFYQMGNVFYDQNLYRKAIEHYKDAVKLDDQNADFHLKLGDCYYRSDIYYNALNEINASLKINPSNYLAHFLQGITVYKQAVLQELVNAFLEILSESGNKSGSKNTEVSGRRKPSIDPKEQRQVYLDMVEAFSNSIALKPSFMEATFNLALTNHEMGNPDEAEKYYLRTIQINPNLIRAHLKMAELFAEQNRKPEAIEQYRRIFYIDPRFFVLHPTLGAEFQYINVLDKFRAETEKNLQRDPDNPRENLVLARLFQEKGEYGKAANLARKVLSITPNNRTAKKILAQIQKHVN